MDTSDSECFESADEDFRSDSEDEITEKKIKQKVKQLSPNFQDLKISENAKSEEKISVQNDEINKNVILTDIQKDTHMILNKEINKDLKNTVNKCKNDSIEFKDNSNKVEINSVTQQGKLESKVDNVPTSNSNNLENKPIEVPQDVDGWDLDDEDNLWKEEEMNWSSQKDLEYSELKPMSKKLTTEKIETKSDLKQKRVTNLEQPTSNFEENIWDNDDWGDFEKKENSKGENPIENEISNTSWGGWGNWGVSSLLNTATQGVSTLTNQVSQGLNNVLESGIGIPAPEELAKMRHEEQKQFSLDDLEKETSQVSSSKETTSGFVFGNLGNLVSGVTNITKFVESTSTKMIAGGLDTLETIGKKTMEVLQEGDPGLKKKRAFLKLDQEKPILSQILREAKEKAERENSEHNNKLTETAKKPNYESLFDDHHGLVHLEALEMLSKQCEIKLTTLMDASVDDDLIDLQETMDQVKELCELPDEDEEEQLTLEQIKEKINSSIKDIQINLNYERLLSTWEEAEQWLNSIRLNICDENELHQQAIETLAQLTALAVEQFHKAGELLLIKEHRSTADEADSLVQ